MNQTIPEISYKVPITISYLLLICAIICALIFSQPPKATVTGISPEPVESESNIVSPLPKESLTLKTESALPVSELKHSENPQEPVNPYEQLSISDAEKELLACMVYNDARGEPFEGQVAVVQVALNRYLHDAFKGDISDILLAPNQFSVGNIYGEQQMEAVNAALAGEPALDLNTDVVFFSTGSLTYGSYYKTIGGHVFRTYH